MHVTTADKRATFRKMHESGCFILPNPVDIGSAKALQHLGFKALASSSAGFAWTIGKADNHVSVEEVCQHLATLSSSVDIPVNADFEGGFAVEPDKVADNVERCVRTGVAGLSIEDSTGNKDKPIYERALAVERIKASRKAIGDSGVLLVGRCEAYLWGVTDLKLIIDRLTLQEAADLGVRRISVGGSLARAAWGGFMRAAKEMAEKGTFSELASGYPGGELNKMFS
jgi:2-methylisocitrate lyase-like PEP mutase family enzyme